MAETDVVATRVAERLALRQEQVEPAMKLYLRGTADVPESLGEAMRYSVFGGGKRIRPAILLAACELCGGSAEDALAAGAAIECVHAFSLVHDDLPCMDDDDLRRGRATTHKAYGEAMALLAGDALLALAFGIIVQGYGHKPVAAKLCGELHEATGWQGMIAGQVADLQGEDQSPTRELVDYIHEYKTGRLIRCACRMGAIVAGVDGERLAALGRYGKHLGLAFQITDDLLDATATAEQVGKRTGKDAAAGKQTYPQVLGLAGSRQAASHQIAEAINALEPFGSAAEELTDLARYILDRSL